jgi:3-oxoacyl-[acyl-carrier protein] reductase
VIDSPVMLITGTRKGIGKYLAEYYVRKGFYVIGCSRQPADYRLENYEHFCADVSDEVAVKDIFTAIRKKYNRLDVLLNNAGVAAMNHVLLTPLSAVRQILDTNVTGTFLFCREAARLMQKARYGRIVNFATVAVPLKLEGEAAYAASKAAVVSLTQILARELAEWGITVNTVGPTPVDTDLIRSVSKEKIDQLIHRQAIQRLGEPQDIANVIDFFIHPKSDFVTGQIIYLGGVA